MLQECAQNQVPDTADKITISGAETLAEINAKPAAQRDTVQIESLNLPRREDYLTRPDLFDRYSEERSLSGAREFGMLCVSGFGASAYSMQEMAHVINKRCGTPMIISPLASHRTYDDFKHLRFNDWVEQIASQAQKLSEPVGVFYSASSLAAIEAQTRYPGLFKGFVFIGTPLKLHGMWKRLKIAAVDCLDQAIASVAPSIAKAMEELEVATYTNFDDGTKVGRRCSVYTHSSVNSILELRHGAVQAYRTLKNLTVPLLYLQGENDPIVSRDVPGIVRSLYKPELLTTKIYPGEGHGPHFGHNKRSVFSDIVHWIEKNAAKTS